MAVYYYSMRPYMLAKVEKVPGVEKFSYSVEVSDFHLDYDNGIFESFLTVNSIARVDGLEGVSQFLDRYADDGDCYQNRWIKAFSYDDAVSAVEENFF